MWVGTVECGQLLLALGLDEKMDEMLGWGGGRTKNRIEDIHVRRVALVVEKSGCTDENVLAEHHVRPKIQILFAHCAQKPSLLLVSKQQNPFLRKSLSSPQYT